MRIKAIKDIARASLRWHGELNAVVVLMDSGELKDFDYRTWHGLLREQSQEGEIVGTAIDVLNMCATELRQTIELAQQQLIVRKHMKAAMESAGETTGQDVD